MPPQPAPRQTLRPSMPSAGILNASNSSSTHTRGPSMLGLNPSNSNNNALIQRLNERKAELANLQELKALSATLASQMVLLEEKLRTLSGGAESVAAVLANWGDVLGAVGMASGAVMKTNTGAQEEVGEETPLPETLVRIPVAEMDAMRAKDAGE